MAMSHPNYVELMNVVNKDVEEGEAPVINSRYSIVMATAKRARQIVNGADPLVEADPKTKPLSIAVDELYRGKIQILGSDDADNDDTAAVSLQTGSAEYSSIELGEDEDKAEDEEADENKDTDEDDSDNNEPDPEDEQ
ncbi:MAG: DNA-directed RNA polymerase subunit omega [Lachnospiraceae bacterium]|jgi:DNA-directed RNA polymerase subunit omega|nr:DNA-directed RNA polymerase subunit omega [Lachnospiraceae bacterium]